MSRIDALAAAERLEAKGAIRAGGAESPEIVFVQTCTVTNRADRDGRRLLRRLKRESPHAVLVAAGCLAQRDPESLARLPEVDLVLGHGETEALASHLRDRDAGLLPGKIVWSAAEAHRASDPLVLGVDPDRTRAFLKLQDGCERRCAFCVVPSVRGPERSAPAGDVEERIRRLGDEGVPEVVLAGVHLANYGKDRATTLLELLSRLEAAPPACRVRLSSLEPMEAGAELIDLVSRSRVVVPHLHLPLQSGSDAVLRRMRRGITAARYRALAARALANPRLHLATDLVVGFPGETDEEFAETAALVLETRFASLHVFPFSPRSGTHGAVLYERGAVPDAV
ncbi:MAG TPA: MiaB/RimO family radical SAM methylthiotransferase, partial [Thermoanaerobaculia bacterium]|nr:MiaB/RimO family radical SAM methylthiotransferase [Thermoanaerobaculia bacterium]